MSHLITGILHEYESELDRTKKVLASLREEHKDWKPHEKSMSVGRMASHIVELQTWFNNALKNDSFDLMSEYKPLEYNSLNELIDILIQGVEENMKFVKDTDESFWFEHFTFKMGDRVIAKLPRIAFLRSILTNHFIHHRGQLTVYLRILNIPVPGVYGPSADEM